MTVPPKGTSNPPHTVADNSKVSDFVGVLGELQAIIEEENDFLSRGLPATLLDTTELKGRLSQEYAQLGNELVDGAATHMISNPELHGKLLEASAQLFALTEENRKLLCDALAATRRRVDMVMDAVRASVDDEQQKSTTLSLIKPR
jgi:hypothetical protein